MTDPASATPSLPAPASISLISSIFAAAQFLRHLALYILSCGQLEGRRRGGGTGNAGIFPSFTRHRHLPINFLDNAPYPHLRCQPLRPWLESTCFPFSLFTGVHLFTIRLTSCAIIVRTPRASDVAPTALA